MRIPPVYREGLPVLLLSGIGLSMAGFLFGGMEPLLEKIPGLVVLIPGLLAQRGMISNSLGARLSSSVHLGLVSPSKLKTRIVLDNIWASIILSVVMSAILGLFAYISGPLLGRPTVGPHLLVGIAVATGTLSSIFLAGITLGAILVAFKRGYDPDNIIGPTLATVGDFVTMLILFSLLMAMGVP